MLSVRFWGVRGSIPCPGPDTVIYGGNTSCLEIRADDHLIIIDLGTGVRPLGEWLIENDLKKYGKISADILITHTHWDHIMGFPMFNPVYVPGTELRITGPVTFEDESLKAIMETQLSYQYWPVTLAELAAKIEYNQIKETTMDLGDDLTITSKFLNHTISCLGYRVDYKGKSIATVYDHEQYRNLFAEDNSAALEGKIAAAEENEKVRQFIRGADIVIHDSQYTQDEYASRTGWGHSSYNDTVDAVKDNDVKKVVFFHHEPSRKDSELAEIEKQYEGSTQPQIVMAREGLILEA
ncbi:MAG: MBL fold metallo-hydrolase [Treponema sp.]|nr:MBL fold metallo-hydrolase [Treponema sp.]MCL2237187.1 MBL fold metallo-hydrolase [Treponema sp.]